MNDVKKLAKAMKLLAGYIHQALEHPFDGSEPWSRADCDSIKFLTMALKQKLPKSFLELVELGIPQDDSGQVTFAERLERALELHEQFGSLTDEASMGDLDEDLGPTFVLKPDERERVLHLSEKIRKIIFSSTVFDTPHKRRLLNRVAAIEREVHQDKGKLDVVLAGISDVGDTLKKFGGDLKPLSDRYSEIVQLTRSKSEQYEQIPPPPDPAALPSPDAEE